MIAKRLFLNHSPSEWFSFIQKAIRFISFQKYGWLFPPVLMNTSDLLQLGVFLSADAFFFRVMLSVP